MSTTQVPPQQGLPPKKSHKVRNTLAAIGTLIVMIIVIAVAASGGGGSKPSTATSPTAPAASAPAAAPTTPAPTSKAPAPKTTAPSASKAPAMTVSQQQALTSARQYLDLGTGFSRAGLIEQLSSSAGEGFSKADATWAADHSGADWNAQAVLAAKAYMDLGTGFSRQGLIEQLTSSAGSGFTMSQAEHAADAVGL